MDENDIIIALADHIIQLGASQKMFSIKFDETDKSLGLPNGSTQKHLEAAAEDAGYDVVRKGSTQASLQKSSGIYIA
jgi:hypothetical protein